MKRRDAASEMAGLSAAATHRSGPSLRAGDGALFQDRAHPDHQLTPTTGPAVTKAPPKPREVRKAPVPPLLRGLPDPDNTVENKLSRAWILYHDPRTRRAVCQRPHQLLPLKRVAALGPCPDDDCHCIPDYTKLARACCFVASHNGGPMMADGERVRPACRAPLALPPCVPTCRACCSPAAPHPRARSVARPPGRSLLPRRCAQVLKWFAEKRAAIDRDCYVAAEAEAPARRPDGGRPMGTGMQSPPRGRQPLGSIDRNSADKRPAGGGGSASKRTCRRGDAVDSGSDSDSGGGAGGGGRDRGRGGERRLREDLLQRMMDCSPG